MLSNEKVKEVKRLLASGASSRRTAKLTGVSRNFVSKIAKGKRTETERGAEFLRNGPIERCSCCGRKIMMPCHACLVKPIRLAALPCETLSMFLGINLKNEERNRYEKIKAWRQAQPNPDFVHLPVDWPFWK